MQGSLARRVAALGLVAAAALAAPIAAYATVTGGCTATGTATSGGVDLTTAAVWHVKKDDVGGGTGQGPTAKSASVGAYALGLSIPIASGTSKDGETSGSVSGVSVSTFALLGARFTVAGSADNGCSGSVTIIIDDVNPVTTALGGGGIAAAIIGLVALLLGARSQGGVGARIVDALFGLLGGAGLGVALEQFGVIDPTQPIGLGIAIVGGLLGLVTCGMLRPKPPMVAPA